jgi:hypothetical protein
MRSWLGVVVAAALVTGASSTASADGSRAAHASPEAKAAALAGQIVAEMRFPAGTKPASLPSIPKALASSGPPGQHWAKAERLLVAPVKPAAVWAVLLPHKPFGDGGSMGTAASSGPVGTSALLPAPEPGIPAAEAAVWLEPWHDGGTLIAAYGFATWLPVRTAAEHLNSRSFRSVTVTADTVVPHQGTVTRTFTSASVIARIAGFLNSLPAAPELAIPCPMMPTTYRATFTGDATVTASSGYCMTDQITVNGAAQPLVWDRQGGLARLLGDLLGLVHGG